MDQELLSREVRLAQGHVGGPWQRLYPDFPDFSLTYPLALGMLKASNIKIGAYHCGLMCSVLYNIYLAVPSSGPAK